VQSSILTGRLPRDHGVVGNGWYNRELAEIQFWKQSNHLVHGEKVWDEARRRDPSVTCAQMFWWFNMYASVDFAVTPRPCYKADGRKIPDVHSHPADLRDQLQRELGPFPLFKFWGPAAGIESSRWIADASIRVQHRHSPTLTLIYLPHLDYCLQKLGPRHPDVPKEVAAIDALVGQLLDHFESTGHRVILLSEYGIEPVDDAVAINRALRRAGLLQVREEQGGELLDAGASAAFAVADHQIAHVHIRDEELQPRVRELCASLPGVELVLGRGEQAAHGIDHPRAGDLVLVSDSRHWFCHDCWLDDACAPDFQRTVDIHRKPGYDPRELFLDPAITFPKLTIGTKLLRRRLGFRTLLDVIPLDAKLVRGSHGRTEQEPSMRPLLITGDDKSDLPEEVDCTAVRDVILDQLFKS
jgi:predicted AlkP superfamily pyrophosphatase or phosphodiesterase